MSSILFGHTLSTQYRVRLYPPFGYSILYEKYNLTRFNHQKITTHLNIPDCDPWARRQADEASNGISVCEIPGIGNPNRSIP